MNTFLDLTGLSRYKKLVTIVGGEQSFTVSHLYFDFNQCMIYARDFDAVLRIPFQFSGASLPSFYVPREDLLHILQGQLGLNVELDDAQKFAEFSYIENGKETRLKVGVVVEDADIDLLGEWTTGEHLTLSMKRIFEGMGVFLAANKDTPSNLAGVAVAGNTISAISHCSALIYAAKSKSEGILPISGRFVSVVTSLPPDSPYDLSLTSTCSMVQNEDIFCAVLNKQEYTPVDLSTDAFQRQMLESESFTVDIEELSDALEYLSHFYKQVQSRRVHLSVESECVWLRVEDAFMASKQIKLESVSKTLVGKDWAMNGDKLALLLRLMSGKNLRVSLNETPVVVFQGDFGVTYLLAQLA